MSETFGIKRLKRIDDWIEVVSAKNYRENFSAFECANRWSDVKTQFPEPIGSILRECPFPELTDLAIRQIYAEFPVWLDTHSTPSKNDLMIFTEAPGNRKVTIAVEAKCEESFSEQVKVWVRKMDKPIPRRQRKLFNAPGNAVPRKLRRLAFLNEVLCLNVGVDSPVRYQLLHRLASAILIARQTFAEATVMLVQAFTDSPRNFEDFRYFCSLLGFENATKNRVIGPYYTYTLPNIPVYLLYVQDRRQSDGPLSPLFENPQTTEAA
mgnify:CR=1 FL=1